MAIATQLRDRVQGFFGLIKEHAEGKGAAAVLVDHGSEVVTELVKTVEDIGGSGAEKKAAVLEMLGEFYDKVIEPIDLPGPDAIIDPILKRALLAIAGVAIDRAVARLFPKPSAA